MLMMKSLEEIITQVSPDAAKIVVHLTRCFSDLKAVMHPNDRLVLRLVDGQLDWGVVREHENGTVCWQEVRKPPEIEFGSRKGTHFSQGRWDKLIGLANELAEEGVAIQNVKIWYDKNEDYHRLAFDVDGDHYDIRYYKAFYIIKNDWPSIWDGKNFAQRDWDIVEFFKSGKHRNWKEENRDESGID